MKVLQVIDVLNVGGAERVFVDMVNMLADSPVQVEVLLFRSEGVLTKQLDPAINLNLLNRVNKYSFRKLQQTHAVCKRFDIVHVHMRHCYAYVKLARVLFGGSYKVILHDHYGDIAIDNKVPFRLKWALKPRYYIGVSRQLTMWAAHNVKPNKTYLLRNTVIPDARRSYRRSATNRALMIANIRKTKNIEFAIALANKLGIELTIYGNKYDVDYAEHISNLLKQNQHVRIVEGVTDFSAVYNQYNLAIHCAVSETGPLVLLEYMANGIPFLAYKTGEVAEAVSNELPDNFIDSFDMTEWGKRITQLSNQQDMSSRLREVFRRNFSPENYKNECLKIYQDVNS